MLPEFIDRKFRYIVCPDINCTGFTEQIFRCTLTDYSIQILKDTGVDASPCPFRETAKMVVFCYYGHPIENKVDSRAWARADCYNPSCNSLTFSKMSSTTIRVPIEEYEEFLKLKIK